MKRLVTTLALSAALFAIPAMAAVTVGKPAPDFALTDLQGKPVKLSDYKGKFVVLEWVNPECPFVEKHYSSSNMQTLQKDAAAKQVTWLAINSTNASHSEYKSPEQMRKWLAEQNAAPAATLLDQDGKVGRLYGAKTTPHMYIINPQGELVYAGAIDDKRSTNPADIKTSKNYVTVALNEAIAGKPVSTASTTAYGCSVKY
jgi:peroxiredoxin